jgi:hypothetical protein
MDRLSVDDTCKDVTCHSVYRDDDPEYLIIVGNPVADGTVPVGPGEGALRVKRQVIVDAQLG